VRLKVIREPPLIRPVKFWVQYRHGAVEKVPTIRELQRTGANSLHQIADALNAKGISTPRGGHWYAKSVSNLLARA
jgi:hypothetical protein